MSDIDAGPFPKPALIAVMALLGVSLAGTAAVRLARVSGPVVTPIAPASAVSVDLRFSDQPDGSIRIDDDRSGALVATLAPDTNGFIRGVMRGLARDRISRHIGEAPPFRLSQDHAGKLWLQDTATHRLIDLEAFGTGNRAAFAELLQPRAPAAAGAESKT
ncbi:hypothetical protein BH09PSE2_BH09PSE2_16830 [soil metagenome]